MKKRFFITLLAFFVTLSANALEKIKYDNLKNNEKITYQNDVWTKKIDKKSSEYFVKRTPEGISKFSEFYSSDDLLQFATATQYEFINKGQLIGYSNFDLKFYEYRIENGLLEQRELIEAEIEELFPKYKIIKISEFSTKTNSLKYKKGNRNLKLILLNDTDRCFHNYGFTTNNAKIEKYLLKGFLNVKRRGMIQFSKFGENTKDSPWFVLLVR